MSSLILSIIIKYVSILLIALDCTNTLSIPAQLNRVGLKISDYNNTNLLCERGFYGQNDYHCKIIDKKIRDFDFDQYNHKPIHRIALYGDSLMFETDVFHDLSNKLIRILNATYSNVTFDVIVCAQDGLKASTLLPNVHNCLTFRPHTMIVLWDTDNKLLRNGNDTTKNDYIADVKNFIILMKAKVPHLAISGPTTYGELPHGQNLYDKELDWNTELNKNISSTCGISYIDIRKKQLHEAIQRSVLFYPLHHGSHGMGGYLTTDGTHPNKLSTETYVDLLSKQIGIFYSQSK